jgi:hypothetical protein
VHCGLAIPGAALCAQGSLCSRRGADTVLNMLRNHLVANTLDLTLVRAFFAHLLATTGEPRHGCTHAVRLG